MSSQKKSQLFSRYSRPLTLGHRGVPEEHQENTMAGFQRAIELGLDGVELDVFLTKDKRVVVFHDAETERLTGYDGKIAEMTWDEMPQSIGDSRFRRWLMESSLVGKLVGSTLTNMSVNMIDNDTIETVQRRGLAVGTWTLFSQDSK